MKDDGNPATYVPHKEGSFLLRFKDGSILSRFGEIVEMLSGEGQEIWQF